MQSPNVSITNLTINLYESPRTSLPAIAVLGAAVASAVEATEIPQPGQAWAGEGGFNGGYRPAIGDVPEHYLIIGADDIGDHKYGGEGKESGATSKTDGAANTKALIESDADHPAAQACAEYTADGHHDFHLPSIAELHQSWLYCPKLFDKKPWYASSSQFSANTAYIMDFSDGFQDSDYKSSERRVRPVRRKFI